MADYIVTSGELTTVANAIRAKNGTSSNLSWPDGFVSGISSGSGGGGSSDFSTAEVTIVVPPFGENLTWNFAYILDFPGGGGGMSNGDYIVKSDSSPDIKSAILYKGNASLYAPVPSDFNLSISGNITDDGNDYYIITGDCTITISQRPR